MSFQTQQPLIAKCHYPQKLNTLLRKHYLIQYNPGRLNMATAFELDGQSPLAKAERRLHMNARVLGSLQLF
jgi:hypothetical protein